MNALIRVLSALLGGKLAYDDNWITVKPNGPSNKGQPALLGENGEVKAGMGGKFNGKKISEAKSKPKAEKSPSPASAAAPSAKPSQAKSASSATPAQPAQQATKKQTPKEMQAQQQAEQQAKHDAAKVEMSSRESEAMKNYSGAMYRDLNDRLRKGKGAARDDASDLKEMDKVFQRASTKESMDIYRGIGPELVAKLTPGTTFKDGGFTSGTANRDIAEGYSSFGGPGGAVLEIKVPKGSKAVSLKNISAFGGETSTAKTEEEILLNRGSNFKVVEVVQDKPRWVKGRFGSHKVTPPPRIIVELVQ